MRDLQGFWDIWGKQKKTVADLENEIKELESADFIEENKVLQEELASKRAAWEELECLQQSLAKENEKLKSALSAQIYNEKMNLLQNSQRRLSLYFQAKTEGELNRLTHFERIMQKRIKELGKVLHEQRLDLEDELFVQLRELEELLNKKVTLWKEEIARQKSECEEKVVAEVAELAAEELSEAQLQKVVQQNDLEVLLGLNVFNKAAVFFLIIGIIAVSQYTFLQLSDVYKGVFGFSAGLGFLIIGEFFNRRETTIFSLGLTSGGFAVLFATLAFSYFSLGILERAPALFLCLLITVGAFVLAVRYNAQTIASFALLGGYLPLFSISGSNALVYSAMFYFVILNLYALTLSTRKKWWVASFLGFSLSVFGSLYIMNLLLGSRLAFLPFMWSDLPLLVYLAFTFALYTFIPLSNAYFRKLSLGMPAIILLALNTAISALLMYVVFYAVNLQDYTGILATFFAVFYLSLGWSLEKYLTQEKNGQALFYLTGLTFVILIIPFQFGKVWLSLGWLIEGTALLVYGILKERVNFRQAGSVIMGFCLAAFFFFDFLGLCGYESLFVYKYGAITGGTLLVLAAAYFKRTLASRAITFFKYGTTINLWFFLLYLIGQKLGEQLNMVLQYSSWDVDYLTGALQVVVSLFLAYLIPQVKLLVDQVMQGISLVIYLFGLSALWGVNGLAPYLGLACQGTPLALKLVATLIIVLVNLLAILALRDLLLRLVAAGKLGWAWYSLLFSAYFILILTKSLLGQYDLAFTNTFISIAYLVLALFWIVWGFHKKFSFMRRFGLGLSIMAIIKLFLVDLSFLTEVSRIVAYFAFGLILLAVSFVYQHFNHKLTLEGEVLADEQNVEL